MKPLQNLMFKSFATLSLISTVFTGFQTHASQTLLAGSGPVALPGSSASAEADLAGTVVVDKLIPFKINSATGALLFQGVLQDRVVKSNSNGEMHFYYRIRDTKAGLNGIINLVATRAFQSTRELKVDWRPDGLGTVNPISAFRSPTPGTIVRFEFEPTRGTTLVGGQESKFFFIKTTSKRYHEKGQTKIQLTTGESVVLATAEPLR